MTSATAAPNVATARQNQIFSAIFIDGRAAHLRAVAAQPSGKCSASFKVEMGAPENPRISFSTLQYTFHELRLTMRFRLPVIAIIAVACACLSPALAQPMGGMMGMQQVIKVNKCDPQLNTNAYPGYVAGYYPRVGPYGWYDVYGVRYTQPV